MSRILFCTYGYFPYAAGGAERQAQLQAEELTKRGHHVTVVSPRWSGTATGVVGGVRVVRLGFMEIRRLKRLSYLARLFVFLLQHAQEFELLCVHLAEMQADVAVIAGAITRRPVWVKLASGGKGGEIARMHRHARATRYIGLRHARMVQAISSEIASEAIGIGVRPTRLIRIPNGVDTNAFSPASPSEVAAIRRTLGLPPDRTIILFVGRLSRQKGIHELLRAWSQSDRKNALLVLVGSFNTVNPIARFEECEDLLLRDWTASISDYYRAADVFVLPSYLEGMSNAMLEAMACGLAIIGTNVGAAQELIEDGRTGLLVKPSDEAALGKALAEVLEDPARRRQYGTSAARAVRRSYSIESVVDKLEDAYREIVVGK